MSVTIQILTHIKTPTNKIAFAHKYTHKVFILQQSYSSLWTHAVPPWGKQRERERGIWHSHLKKSGCFSPPLNSLHYLSSSSSSFSLPPQDQLKGEAERIKWSAVPLRKESGDSLQRSPRHGPCPWIRGRLRGSTPWGCKRPRSCSQIRARWYDNHVMLCHLWYIVFSAKTARSD